MLPSDGAHAKVSTSAQSDGPSGDSSQESSHRFRSDAVSGSEGDGSSQNAQGDGGIHEEQSETATEKEKDKTTVTADTLDLKTIPRSNGQAHLLGSGNLPKKSGAVNGSGLSRKRSRSGSRLPQAAKASSMELPHRTKEIAYKVLLDQYVNHELVHSAAMIQDKADQEALIIYKRDLKDEYIKLRPERQMNPAAYFGAGYAGYGNGTTNVQGRGSMIVYPAQRRRPGGRRTRELHISRKDIAIQSEQLDELVPIRLDIEWDKIRLRDTFTWNLHDRVVRPDLFAEQLVEDFKLPPDQCRPLVQQVTAHLEEQIRDFHPQVFVNEEALDPHLPYYAYKNDEMRITIKLNITIGTHTLVDQFEWDINNPMNSPEEFAQKLTEELSLSGEFTTAIAHSIREQSQLFTRSLYVTGHTFDGRPVEDQELKASFLASPLPSPFRPYQAAKDFTPYLYELNEAELDKTELSLSREERRQKRSVNRRGGPALPDLKDRRRTIRTLVVSSVLPGAAENQENSRIFKRVATSGRGRRPGMGHKDDDSESESEESLDEDPPIPAHLLSGTARTRGMRGAATVAQAAVRGQLGRSATPDSASLHHHETRTSGRRFGVKDYREESDDEAVPSLIVKFHINSERYRELKRGLRHRNKLASHQPLSMDSSHRDQSTTPGRATPMRGSMGPPPSTPGTQPRQHSTTPSQQQGTPHPLHPHAASIGRVDALGPPSAQHPTVGEVIALPLKPHTYSRV